MLKTYERETELFEFSSKNRRETNRTELKIKNDVTLQ